ncbi:peptidase S8 [Schaalia georgiae]|nr:peptidase S8 [Schaalia georgiae]
MRRWGVWGVGRGVVVWVLVVCAGVVGAPVAWGVEEIGTQDYVAALGLGEGIASGALGAGVGIGVIDGPADTSVPELAGADVTVKQMCDFTPTDESRSHGTAVVSVLAARGYGVARGARIINYAIPTKNADEESGCAGVDVARAIGAAVADGVRVISISLANDDRVADAAREAVAMAVARGVVVVVVGAGNDGAVDPPGSYASLNGTVGAGASDGQGRIKDYSNRGRGLTVLAPGDIRWRDLGTGRIEEATGTSFAAPIVAGLVAVAMSEWPGATSNQVLQALVATATAGPTGQPLISPGGLGRTDPAQYPDQHPLMDKFPGTEPSAAMVADYRDGLLATDSVFDNDPSYTYRGTDPDIVHSHPNRTALGTSPRYHTPHDQ